jgi:hypothetical protein
MEDLQVLIYIVFGIIYLIFGALKKRRKGPDVGTPPLFEEEEVQQRRRHMEQPQADVSEPGSLEELLERYDQAARRAKSRSAEKTETMMEQVDDEFIPVSSNEPTIRNLEQEALEQLQRTEYLKSVQEELPAKARAEVLAREPAAFTSGKPKKRVGKRKESQRRLKPYDRKKQPVMSDRIRTLLSSPQGFRQAIILTEVLNRKHF